VCGRFVVSKLRRHIDDTALGLGWNVVSVPAGALSVASAIFLILELDAPYSGILRLPPTPILEAIDALGK
jgi:hypothetical protein